MKHYAELSGKNNPQADSSTPGAGAAGGLGFAFLTYTNATLESGINIVLAETRLEDHIADANLVITGEGRLDSQTVMGKAPIGVAKIAKRHQKPVIALSGCVAPDARLCNQHGIDAYFPVLQRISSLAEAMDTASARQNVIDTAEQVMRLILTARNHFD